MRKGKSADIYFRWRGKCEMVHWGGMQSFVHSHHRCLKRKVYCRLKRHSVWMWSFSCHFIYVHGMKGSAEAVCYLNSLIDVSETICLSKYNLSHSASTFYSWLSASTPDRSIQGKKTCSISFVENSFCTGKSSPFFQILAWTNCVTCPHPQKQSIKLQS